MTFGFIRALFVLISAVVGYQLGTAFGGVGSALSMYGIVIGVSLAAFIIFIVAFISFRSTCRPIAATTSTFDTGWTTCSASGARRK